MSEVKIPEEIVEMCETENAKSNMPSYLEEFILALNTEKIADIPLESEKFTQGVDSVSSLCGAITALVNVGITPDKAMEYLVDKEMAVLSFEYNLKIAIVQKDAAVETAKLNYINKIDN